MILERAATAWKRGGVATVVKEGRSSGGFAGSNGRERVRDEWMSSVIWRREVGEEECEISDA